MHRGIAGSKGHACEPWLGPQLQQGRRQAAGAGASVFSIGLSDCRRALRPFALADPVTCPDFRRLVRWLWRSQSRPLGRGPGTGKGKTSGRGHKGRRARSGGSVRLGFEGGQTPLYLRLPKFGFNRKDLQEPLEELTLGRLQLLIDQGRIDASKRITITDIAKSGAVSRVRHGIKVLATVRWCLA